MNFNDKAMQSLLEVYAKCGGDPNELIEKILKAEYPPLPEGEAAFFKSYEKDLNG